MMKRLFIFLCLFLAFFLSSISAQNMLHYAVGTNGERGECLFPEDDSGNVFFSSIIDVPLSADTIMMIADDYVSSQNSDKCVITRLSNSARTCTYNVQLNIGKQSWGMELWGSPLFVMQKDASHLKFKCILEARNGKFKYSLVEFETNRNTIRGEAKNDGQPNTLHWQRVNSLVKERDAYAASHNSSKRSTKEELFDFNAQIAYEACLYQAEYDATVQFERGLKEMKFDDSFIDLSHDDTESEDKLNKMAQGRSFSLSVFGDGFFSQSGSMLGLTSNNNSNYSDYHGFLLNKGNNVFITSDKIDYEQSGAYELMKQTMIDGFWNVVDDINKAHFVIKYYVNLQGRDKAHMLFSTPDNKTTYELGTNGASESVNENKEVARDLYKDYIMPLYKKIEENKIPKGFNAFIR